MASDRSAGRKPRPTAEAKKPSPMSGKSTNAIIAQASTPKTRPFAIELSPGRTSQIRWNTKPTSNAPLRKAIVHKSDSGMNAPIADAMVSCKSSYGWNSGKTPERVFSHMRPAWAALAHAAARTALCKRDLNNRISDQSEDNLRSSKARVRDRAYSPHSRPSVLLELCPGRVAHVEVW